MNTNALEREMSTLPTSAETEALVETGFTSEEITSLLWLRAWYQNGGSDRAELVRHWEFLRFLVNMGQLPG